MCSRHLQKPLQRSPRSLGCRPPRVEAPCLTSPSTPPPTPGCTHHLQVFSAVQDRFGKESAEVQLVSVRLGISSAACGRLEAGLKLIYDAAPVLQHNLGRMVEQAQAAAAAEGGLDEQAAVRVHGVVD